MLKIYVLFKGHRWKGVTLLIDQSTIKVRHSRIIIAKSYQEIYREIGKKKYLAAPKRRSSVIVRDPKEMQPFIDIIESDLEESDSETTNESSGMIKKFP